MKKNPVLALAQAKAKAKTKDRSKESAKAGDAKKKKAAREGRTEIYSRIRVKEEEKLLDFFEKAFNLRTINELIEYKERESPDNYLPFYMRGYYLPIYDSFGGKIHDVCRTAAAKLGFGEKEIEFYVANDSEFNGSSIHADLDEKAHIIIINRGLLERVSIDELAFVMGHEIGHLIYYHSYVTKVLQFIYPQYEHLPPVIQKLYDVWSKLGEISADRIGLLACGDIEKSVRALFKLSSGLDDSQFNLTFDNLIRIADKTYAEMKEFPSYVSASHPANPVRIKALLEFHKSSLFRDLAKGRTPRNDRKFEHRMDEVLSLIKKTPLDEQEKVELEFMAAAGVILMTADGEVVELEYHYLINMLARYIHWPPTYLDGLDPDKLYDIMKANARIILEKFPHRTRELIRHLFPILTRDRKLKDEEMQAFMKIATEELQIPVSEVIDVVLSGLGELYQPYS